MIRLAIVIILFNILVVNYSNSIENFIAIKVNNNIITKIDIENEYKYLIALNKNLEKIEKQEVFSLAKESIIRETIKKEEIEKYFDLNDLNNEYSENIFKNFYKNLGLNNEKEFRNYLLKYGLIFEEVKEKIFIEISWNNFIYEKFWRKIDVDEQKIRNIVINKSKEKKDIDYYLLSEILFQIEEGENLNQKYNEIKKNIDNAGFEAAASIYSISDTSKVGGKIGWVDSAQLSKTLKKNIKTLKINNYTGPIVIPGGFLIIKLNDKKIEKKKQQYNIEEEVKKLVKFEENKQLDKFSKIYFNRLKKNSFINE